MRELPEFALSWFFSCLTLLFLPWLLRGYLFHPLVSRYRPPTNLPRQYSLGEFFVLLLQWQVVGGTFWLISTRIPFSARVQLALVLATVQGLWWWLSLGSLNAAAITRPRDRLWFLGVVAPVGFIAGQLIVPLVALALPAILIGLFHSLSHPDPMAWLLTLASIAIALACVTMGVSFTRAESRKIVSRRAAAAPSGIELRADDAAR